MARKSLHEKIFSKSPAERTVGEVALNTGDFSMLPEFGEGGGIKPSHISTTAVKQPIPFGSFAPNTVVTPKDQNSNPSYNIGSMYEYDNWHPDYGHGPTGADSAVYKEAFFNDNLKLADLQKAKEDAMAKKDLRGFRKANTILNAFVDRNKVQQYAEGGSLKNTKKIISNNNLGSVSDGSDNLIKYHHSNNYTDPSHIVFDNTLSILKMLDPTGVSNYPDLYDAVKNGDAGDIGREFFASLPMIGKAGKAIKWFEKTSQLASRSKLPVVTALRTGASLKSTIKDMKFAEGGDVKKPVVVDNSIRAEWNDYVNWLGTTGKKGLPDLDKNDLGFQMLDQYRKINPKTVLTKDYVLPIQKDFQQYRGWAIDQYKAGKLKMASDPGPNYEKFMPELSIEDGYPGSKTTSHTFPNAYLQSTNEDGQTTRINRGFAASAVAKMKDGGGVFSDEGLSGEDAAQGALSALPGILTAFNPDATQTQRGSGIGGGIGAGLGTVIGGPIGAGIGSTIGSFVGGLIGKKRQERDQRERYDSTTSRQYNQLNMSYNANPYGDNSSFYAEEGGQAPDTTPQGPAMTPVNIEKRELAVDPTSFDIVRKFDNKNRYAPHAENAFKEPVGNHIQLPEETIIIPKKLAKTYESGNNITRRSIIANLLKDQTNREHAEGMEGQMKKGGEPYIFPEAGNTAPFIQYPDWTGGYQQPEMKGILEPVIVGGKRSVTNQPGIQDNNDGWAEAPEPTKISKGFKMPHISPVAAAGALNLAPTIYGLQSAFGEDPFLKYDENGGFNEAKTDIMQIPTDVNMEGAKAAMFKAVRSNNRVLNNVNSPSVRAEMASNNTKVLEATGQLYANADNERKNRISDKLAKLSGIAIQQGANQEESRNRYSTELRMDRGNRENLIQHGLSEGATNISKMVMDNERIKSLNAMARYFKLDPKGKQLVDENPNAVQHIIDQLEGGYLPVFQPASTAKGKTSTTTQRDARGRVKQTSQTVKE